MVWGVLLHDIEGGARPSLAMERDAPFHGTHSGRDVDKLVACNTRTEPAERIDSVLLPDARR